jgi:arylsulfatase A-like enzyme
MAQHFEGVIGRDWRDSTPWWPAEPLPPSGAPNVLLIVLDDVGYAQLGCYGSDISTPTIDGLAAEGLRLANFHTTALCSPTRACLLTGRNHHRNGMGRVADLAMGYPGYWGLIPRENGFLSEILRAHGYATYAVGKWHLTPDDEVSMAASRASWPLGRGFDRWYGFHGGETHQFAPALYHDNHAVLAPGSYEDGYHLSADLADRAIEFLSDLRAVDEEQPFFCYLATGACHSPHHAPAEWIERYRGQFDAGWDAWRDATFARQLESGLLPQGTTLSPRPSWVPAWDELALEDQAVAARFMECFAAYLSYTDAQLGRVIEYLRESGDLDNTVVMLCSDNGASSEGGARGSINDVRSYNGAATGRRELRARIDELGGPTTHNNYPWGWTMAGNTPFKRWKREVHEGGVADPCIVRLPPAARTAAAPGGICHQFAHAIDVLPTVLELVGIDAPPAVAGLSQSSIDGTSFGYALADAETPGRHDTQYFEMLGSRAIYHQGWKAVTFHALGNMYDDGLDANAPFDDDIWELYNVANDLSETEDLAAKEPERLAAMVELWWEEARRNDVLPLDNRPLEAILHPRPRRRGARRRYVYRPFGAPVPEASAVHLPNREHTITAAVDIATEGISEGILLAMGSALGGFSFYLRDGRLRYVHNLYSKERHVIGSSETVAPGTHELAYSYSKAKGFSGTGRLLVDGRVVGEGEIPLFTPMSFSGTGGGLTCGYEMGPAVGDDYVAPFRCTAVIRQVVVEVSGEHERDPMAVFQAIMSEQ